MDKGSWELSFWMQTLFLHMLTCALLSCILPQLAPASKGSPGRLWLDWLWVMDGHHVLQQNSLLRRQHCWLQHLQNSHAAAQSSNAWLLWQPHADQYGNGWVRSEGLGQRCFTNCTQTWQREVHVQHFDESLWDNVTRCNHGPPQTVIGPTAIWPTTRHASITYGCLQPRENYLTSTTRERQFNGKLEVLGPKGPRANPDRAMGIIQQQILEALDAVENNSPRAFFNMWCEAQLTNGEYVWFWPQYWGKEGSRYDWAMVEFESEDDDKAEPLLYPALSCKDSCLVWRCGRESKGFSPFGRI